MRNLMPSWVRVPLIFFIICIGAEYFIDSGSEFAFMKYPAVLLFLFLVLLILIAIEAIVSALENIMLHKLDEAAKKRFLAEKNKSYKFTWLQNVYAKLLGSNQPIETESEIVLDHNYDGIKELDNNLPPWWIWGFYISIVFAFVYFLRYQVFNGPNQKQELETELAEARISVEAYKKANKGLVDINNVSLLADASDISAGKTIFEANCVACHMADGGGGIGPNLTDDHWILGGGIKNVFHTVSEGGRSGKGMIAWKAQLKPLEMAQVASYILTKLHGTTAANPKAPEGDIWVDANAVAPTEQNTTEVDTSATPTN